MCVVSFVTNPVGTVPLPYQPLPTLPWTRDTWAEYQEILVRLKELDKKLGQPDCDDPTKREWMQDVEARLAALEGRSKKK